MSIDSPVLWRFSDLSIILNSMSSVVLLEELHNVTLVVNGTSDSETSNLIRTHTEDSVIVNIEIERHW